MIACAAAARAAEDNPFVTSGGEVLRERMQIPWYNAETNEVQPITLLPPPVPSDRRSYSWLTRPITIVFVIILTALLLLLAWLIVRIIREREHGARAARAAKVDPLLVADRIEALPFLRERLQHDLLGQARHHYQMGNYSEAIIYLFSHELVELDRSAVVRLARGKTNRQYLREARTVRPLAALLERTMTTFEDVFFGRRALDRAGFETCWNQLDQFENLVSQAHGTA